MAETLRDPRCGTPAGYSAHIAAGEDADPDCKRAHADRMRTYMADPVNRERQRRRGNARQRALVVLRREHPERFEELLAQALPEYANVQSARRGVMYRLRWEHLGRYRELFGAEMRRQQAELGRVW